MKRILVLLSAVVLLAGCCRERNEAPRNVILIVGDGMGVAQVYSSVVAEKGDNSAFLRFPFTGFSRTYSLDKYRTDSSAGGTALTTGEKVENYHVNWAPDSTRHNTIFDDAIAHGLLTGFVVTSDCMDATPASKSSSSDTPQALRKASVILKDVFLSSSGG